MRIAGKLAAEVLDMIEEHIRPGISTEELDTLCHPLYDPRTKSRTSAAELSRFPKIYLHIGQPRYLPRYTQ